MNVAKEFRLSGRLASTLGITRLINRHLRARSLRRVEVRLSSQTAPPVHAQEVQSAIRALLREHGTVAEVSVRAVASPIEDALGEHTVRLIHVDEPPAPRWPWPKWVRRWLARWFPDTAKSGAPATPAQHAGPRETDTTPKVSQRQAVELLKTALAAAVEAEGPGLSKQPITQAHITVRQPSLHAAMQPLLAKDPTGGASWIARLLSDHRLQAADNLVVKYAFAAPQGGEGTVVAGGSDIEVWLSPDAGRSPLASLPLDPDCTLVGADDNATLMPAPAAQAMPAATIRVMGTTEQRFAEPFEVFFQTLPARFDRAALEAAGFAARHGAALRVASQSCPLMIDRAPGGGLLLQASGREGAGALPMYFRATGMNGVIGQIQVDGMSETLIVNGPAAVIDPATGNRLPPLVMEVELAT